MKTTNPTRSALTRLLSTTLLVGGCTLALAACGGSEGTKSSGTKDNGGNAGTSNQPSSNSSGVTSCTTDGDCGAGGTCVLGQALSTRQQALCDAGETEVCYDDFGESCVPEGEDDIFCLCDCFGDTGNNDSGEEPDDGETNSTDGETNDPPAGNNSPSGYCASAPSTDEDGDSDDDDSTVNDPQTETNNNDGGSDGAMCDEFSTGSSSFVGDDVYTRCDGFPPQNCRTGGFIWFGGDESECFCALRCDDFDPVRQPGEACDSNGDFVCQYVENASGTSKGNWCIPTSWNDDLDCSQ